MAVEIRAVVITASDGCASGVRRDESGEVLAALLRDIGAEVVAKEILPDDSALIAEKLRTYADREDVNLIMTTGGTGVAPRDNTPEATRAVIEREVPGLSEAMRVETLKQTPMAMISRGVCGTRSGALIVNLPGSPLAVRQCFDVIRPVLRHTVALLAGRSHEAAQ